VGYYSQIAINIMVLITLGVSLNLLLGLVGRVSMAQSILFGVGAFTAARLALPHRTAAMANNVSGIGYGLGWPWWLAVIGAIVVTFLAALLIAIPAVRIIRGEYLILLTLAFQLGGQQIMVVAKSVTGGSYGAAGIPPVQIGGIDFSGYTDQGTFHIALLMLFITAIVVVFAHGLASSPFGRILKTLREQDSVVSSVGKNPIKPELFAFGITAAIAGGIGSIFAFSQGAIIPGNFNLDLSILIVSVVVLGGTGNLTGTFIGAIFLGGLEPVLRIALGDSAIPWRAVIYGCALIAMTFLRPKGILPEGTKLRLFGKTKNDYRQYSQEGSISRLSRSAELAKSVSEEVLELQDLKKSFGGLVAVNGASFRIPRGQITALIGPNGAGKTTIFNMITGTLSPDSGKVFLRGIEITDLGPVKIAQSGIARSFQDVRLCERMTVLENVMMAIPNQMGEKIINLVLKPRACRKREKEVSERALECLSALGVVEKADEYVGDLSYGDQKLVAIARLLATDCEVLLLDEPTSGVDPSNVEGVMQGVLKLRELGCTVCLIEHSVYFVQKLADRAVFLDQGVVLAEGTVESLMSNKELSDLYFGG
jgi:branched-chain amino acid transport system permease protein